jgi:hypothetical protein
VELGGTTGNSLCHRNCQKKEKPKAVKEIYNKKQNQNFIII